MKQKFNFLFIALALQLWPTATFCQDDGNRNQTPAHVKGHNSIDEGGDDDPWNWDDPNGFYGAFVPLNGADSVYMAFEIIDEEEKTVAVGYSDYSGCSIDCDTQGAIEIPSTIHGYTVIGISPIAFSGCTGLTSVVIPNGITYIGELAFWDCSGLTSITIPNSVTSIGGGAFADCTGLSSMLIPRSVTEIGLNEEGYPFVGCTSLTFIVVEDGNPIYDSRNNCNAIILTESNELIFGCKNTIIPNDVMTIGYSAFADCTGLTSITIPNSVTSIGGGAFWGCTGLTSVDIPNSVTSIGYGAFEGCTGLTSIEIPNGVMSIEDGAFLSCNNLERIVVEEGNPTYNSTNSCNAIIETKTKKLIVGCMNTVIPNNVTTIGNSAFQNCSGLTSVEIPNSVTSIEYNAFSGCTGLTSIISYILEPFSIYYCFDNETYENAILYVPAQSIELYRNTDGWNNFKNIRPVPVQILQTELIRMPKQLYINVMFSYEPDDYTTLDEYISLASKDESLKLLSFIKSGKSCIFYFELPHKEGKYTFKVSNTLPELDQNDNGIIGEEDDYYTEDFLLGTNELYVAAQSPMTGVKGKAGYTDIVFNDVVEEMPISQFSLVSPSGKETAITKVDYLDHLTPARYRVYYDTLNEDSIYTFTINQGLKSSKGWDMRYKYQSDIDVPYADLKPMIVTPIDGNWVVGQQASVSYQVKNISEMPAIGKSVDVLYFSPSETWSNEAIEISRDTLDVNLQSQENYIHTIDVKVPLCIEGRYFLILKTNVARTINELSFDDNTLVSDALSLSVDWLTVDNNQFILNRGESRLFKVPVESDKNIEVVDNHGTANMFVGYGDLPNANDEPKNGNVILLSPDVSTTYYLLVSNNNRNQESTQSCELSIRQFDIEITNIGRNQVVKHNTAWILIEVIGCTDMPMFYLTDTHGKRTESKNVRVKSESSFYAQFDTEALLAGKYNLYVECDGKMGMLPNAITIVEEEALPNIKAKLVLPSNSRIGSTITAYIDYENTGNVDITAPLFILTGQEGSKYSLDDHYFVTDEVHIIGINEKGVMNALLPGESNRISVKITIPNEQINSAKYKLKTISEGGDGIDEKFYLQWLDVDPDEKPNCYTDEEWNAYCTRLRNNVGDTWLTFIQALGTVAGMYFSADYIEHDAHFLYNILKEIDLNAKDSDIASNQVNKKRASNKDDGDEPGMIYLYDGGKWLPLVEAIYDTTYTYVPSKVGIMIQQIQLNVKWKQTEHCSKLNSTNYFFISHGMDNNHDEEWIRKMAKALNDHCNGQIICVCWGKLSSGIFKGILPSQAASHINEIVRHTHNALNVAFNGNPEQDISLSNFHFIGHSHGSHVCGRLANSYSIGPKRLTALDESEEGDHWYKENYNRGGRYNAKSIDYYKSSVICGTEWLIGDDNFILSSGDGQFTLNIGEDGYRHGYATTWFTETINENKGIGFHWDRSKHEKIKTYGRIGSTNARGWSGVINGPKKIIEDYTKYFENKVDWNYPTPWYTPKNNQKKPSEWEFRTAFASTIDYESKNLKYYGSKDYIQVGTTDYLKMDIENKADNLTVPLDIRMDETCKHAAQVLFVSKTNSSNSKSVKKDKKSISYITSNADLYYLAHHGGYYDPEGNTSAEGLENAFSFTFTSELWKKLGGTDDMEYMYCDFWLISAVDKSSEYMNSPTRTVMLWKGELYPADNCKIVTLKVKRPTLECDAGKDRPYIIDCHQDYVNVDVNGIVVRDNGKPLSYFWEKNGNVFSHSKTGTIPLGVGRHRLTFRIKVKDENNVKAAFASTSSVNEATDDVYITVKKGTCDEEEEETKILWSWDPNEKVGIRGAGGKSCVRQGETMEYAIYFENDAEKAQLAAQTVTVIDTLDTAFDLSTFEFTGSEVANTYIDIPSGKAETTVYTDLRPANDLILKADMKLDIDTRELKVVYSSLDTLTYEPTQDVFAGFLPPNDSTHIGEGHFYYRVKLRNDVPDGYQVKNQAHIFFDYNDEVATNVTMHTIDSTAPKSTVDGLPSETEKDSIMVSWSGVDDGAGIKYFDVYCSKNGGSYELWKSHVTDHSAIIYGMKGDVYRFYSVATDSLGFVETMKTSPEAIITFTGDPSSVSTNGNDEIGIEYQYGAFIITGAEGATCNVYDLAGQLVASKQRIARRERMAFSKKGVFVVNVETMDGMTVAKKMVVK